MLQEGTRFFLRRKERGKRERRDEEAQCTRRVAAPLLQHKVEVARNIDQPAERGRERERLRDRRPLGFSEELLAVRALTLVVL